MRSSLPVALSALLLFQTDVSAQWIPIRTVPLVTADRTGPVPSEAAGMGFLSLACADTLSDAFLNPARALRLTGTAFFLSPSVSGWSTDGHVAWSLAGSAGYPRISLSTIPLGMIVRSGNVALGGVAAHQRFSGNRRSGPAGSFPFGIPDSRPPSHDLESNSYVAALVAAALPDQELNIGLGFRHATYGAVDGVWILYPGNVSLQQEGVSLELLAGAVQRLSDKDEVEFLAAWNRFRSSHEAVFASSAGINDGTSTWNGYTIDRNEDEMQQWLISVGYRHSSARGWTFGTGLTVNWKEHPKIPNYRLMNIPRDPGLSIAYRFGAGMVWNGSRTVFGLEYVYEPVTSTTWAEAGEQWGSLVPPGVRTVENTFLFTNHILKSGFETRTGLPWLRVRLGAQLHFFRYAMNQVFPLSGSSRFLEVDWLETTATGGVSASLGNVSIAYTILGAFGTGLVGTTGRMFNPWFPPTGGPRAFDGVVSMAGAAFLIAPSGPLIVDTVPVASHQISVVYHFH